MLSVLNRASDAWNAAIASLHHITAKTGVRWLVRLGVWAYDHLTWRLPPRWRLVNGMTLAEHNLRRELELALHQARYYAEYAAELQDQMQEACGRGELAA